MTRRILKRNKVKRGLVVVVIVFACLFPLRVYAESAQGILDEAYSDYKAGNYQRSLQNINDLFSYSKPDNIQKATAWKIAALDYFYLGRRKMAESAFQKLLKISPGFSFPAAEYPESVVQFFTRISPPSPANSPDVSSDTLSPGILKSKPSRPWVVNSFGRIFQWTGSKWMTMPGKATDIGIGGKGFVWITGIDKVYGGHGIYRWEHGRWMRVPGGAVRIDVGPHGNAGVVNSFGEIFRWTAGKWEKLPGLAKDIGIGNNGAMWIIGSHEVKGGYEIYRWKNWNWERIPGGAVRIDVAPDGRPWVVNSFGQIFQWTGSKWMTMPGRARDIGIGNDGTVWSISTQKVKGGYAIYRWVKGIWQNIPGGAITISVGGGSPEAGPPGNSHQSANLINGDFEEGRPAGVFITLGAGSKDLPGWRIEQGSVDVVGTYWKSKAGRRSIDLCGNSYGILSQTIATIPGESYQISFDLSGNYVRTGIKILQVKAGETVKTFSFDTRGHDAQHMGWRREKMRFTAVSNRTKLLFMAPNDSNDPNCGPVIDNVRVSPAD